jgi:hypothetical protein
MLSPHILNQVCTAAAHIAATALPDVMLLSTAGNCICATLSRCFRLSVLLRCEPVFKAPGYL